MTLKDVTPESVVLALPHGSGIDADWRVWTVAGTIIAKCSYHGMDDAGFYDGWADFTVTIFERTGARVNWLRGPCSGSVQLLHAPGDVDFRVEFDDPGNVPQGVDWTAGLLDYLDETIGAGLSEAGILHHTVTEPIDPRRIV